MSIYGDKPIIFPFDREKPLELRIPIATTYAISASGRVMAWCQSPSPLDAEEIIHSPNPGAALESELRIQTTEGEIIARRRFLGDIEIVAVTDVTSRIAFYGEILSGHLPPGMYWRSFDFSQGGKIDSSGAIRGQWSPDGNTLMYEESGEIHLFDVATGRSRTLAKGLSAAWDPSGRRIAFRRSDWRAAMITPVGSWLGEPYGRRYISGPLAWSPDGRFVLIPDLGPVAWLFPTGNNEVCRVADGMCIDVPQAPEPSQWIVGYQTIAGFFAR